MGDRHRDNRDATREVDEVSPAWYRGQDHAADCGRDGRNFRLTNNGILAHLYLQGSSFGALQIGRTPASPECRAHSLGCVKPSGTRMLVGNTFDTSANLGPYPLSSRPAKHHAIQNPDQLPLICT